MRNYRLLLDSSVGRKQIVAFTGLALIVYLVAHLAGNLFIFAGPDFFNAYAKKLASLRPGLYIIEVGLAAVFIIHIYVTALLVLENIRARGQGYAVNRSVGKRSLATRIMPYTGTFILIFVVWHIYDFTLVNHEGPRSILPDGQSYGLYGIVYNSFRDVTHSVLYIIAMFCVGFHLYHGVESFMQTLGLNTSSSAPCVKNLSKIVSFVITFGFSSIPIFVLIDSQRFLK